MFSPELIAVGFLGMMAMMFLIPQIPKLGWQNAEQGFAIVGIVAAAYCVAAGLYLAVGWEDPLAAASTQDIANASAKARGRGGIVILAIQWWPYRIAAIGHAQLVVAINSALFPPALLPAEN